MFHPNVRRRGSVAAAVAFALTAMLFMILPAAAQEPTAIVPLDDPFAPFLESRAYAKSVGATAEFRKMEWVAVDAVNGKLYWAMSEVAQGMSDGEGAINVDENLCGIVYAGDYDADFNLTNVAPLIVGGPFDEANEDNPCDVNNISNPDNLSVDSAGRLWIGEDTSNHANNVLWMWDGALHRFATVPTGSETTGVAVGPDGSLFFNVQHPSGMNPYPYNRGLVGAVNGFKATDSFEDLAVPEGADQNKVMVAAGEYQMLGRVGDPIPMSVNDDRLGELTSVDGSPLGYCNQPDANMLVVTDEAGTEGYLYTNFECIPGAMSKVYVRNNGTEWEVIEGNMVDFGGVDGTWTNCGGNVTPWNTAFSAEEYEPIASTDAWVQNLAGMSDYTVEQANPYNYGYMIELKPDDKGSSIDSLVEKRYALGRKSNENAVVMPDEKTVYFGDDGTDVVFFKFIADEAGDLSAGTLYAAKATQTADAGFDFEWIELGKGNDDEIAEAIASIQLPE